MGSMADDAASDKQTSATTLLAERGLLAFVWLDMELKVRERSGVLADWIEIGARLEDAVPPLLGLEDSIRSLRHEPGGSVCVPNVGLQFGANPPPKFNTQVFWHGPRQCYLMVLSREITQNQIELELRNETQRRRFAESRELEMAKEVRRTNVELQRANRDLAEFAYVISHDLKAPLRALRLTAALLERDLGDGVADEVRASLGRIQLQSKRMAAMMSGLLEYSRIGRKQDAIARVDTRRLLRDIVETMGVPPGLTIEVLGAWPVFETLGEPLDVVLRNLIENAVKHHDTKAGVLRLSAEELPGNYAFSIADDGPGIDPAYRDVIFEPFRKVNDEVSPDSSGIGLALVKKTLELVGGSITLQSDAAQARGAIFRVMWPKTLKDQ